MYISNYNDLLNAANNQDQPQRMLLVFAGAELPDEIAKSQKEQFEGRKGGDLTPVVCADKLASELGGFADLVKEFVPAEMSWDIVFVAGMSGKSGIAPSGKDAEQYLKGMALSVKEGNIGGFIAFNPKGELIQLLPPDKTVI
ncbi:MAG: ribonucleotide reductase subunit alpha [Gallionella sp.]|nr:ribonucleotide reductase subunit alpha [Gallionella sp.]